MLSIPIPTEEGAFLATFSEKGLASLDFPGRGSSALGAPKEKLGGHLAVWVKLTSGAINSVLAGRHPSQLPPLDLSCGTAFQQKVWQTLQAIPMGATATYSEVARRSGNPAAVRAVGRACGANPIPVLIPCHRVLAKGDKPGGFSAGLDWKRILLAREGIRLVEQ